jgi:hypothetical protein
LLVPLIPAGDVLTGAVLCSEATTADGTDVELLVPAELVAVTVSRIVLPTSAVDSL